MLKTIGMTLVGVVASISVAQAGLIVDTVEQNQYLSTWQSYSYTHNINDDGFTLGSAVSGTLSIDIRDNNDLWSTFEWALITVDEFDFDTDGITFYAEDFNTDLHIKALASLNADGMLDVTVSSIVGDFYVGNSVLSVFTEVPEPGTIALFGAGLLGLFAARRHRDSKA